MVWWVNVYHECGLCTQFFGIVNDHVMKRMVIHLPWRLIHWVNRISHHRSWLCGDLHTSSMCHECQIIVNTAASYVVLQISVIFPHLCWLARFSLTITNYICQESQIKDKMLFGWIARVIKHKWQIVRWLNCQGAGTCGILGVPRKGCSGHDYKWTQWDLIL